jgi:hypothetical protein
MSFRFFIGAVIAGTALLAVLTAIAPDAMLMGLLTALLVIVSPFALAVDFLVVAARRKASGIQFSLRQLIVVVTCVALYLSLLSEPWTFRLRFALSRPALERLADQVASEADFKPQWAGLFFIERVDSYERKHGHLTVLWTGLESGFVHPASSKPYNDYSVALRHDPQWSFFIQD